MSDKKVEEQVTYDEATTQIDQILGRLRSGEISIDELSTEVRRATELITLCRNKLLYSEAELKKILE